MTVLRGPSQAVGIVVIVLWGLLHPRATKVAGRKSGLKWFEARPLKDTKFARLSPHHPGVLSSQSWMSIAHPKHLKQTTLSTGGELVMVARGVNQPYTIKPQLLPGRP